MYKIFPFTFCILFTICEYYVVYEPETMLRPPKHGKKYYGPLPGYMVDKMIKSFPSESEETKPEKTETKVEVSEAKGQDNLQIRPLPGQTEEDQITFVVDLDELYLKDPRTRIKTILAYLFLLGLELAVIGYFFGYPIYLDRIEYTKFCEREEKLKAEKLERGKRRSRKSNRRQSKRN